MTVILKRTCCRFPFLLELHLQFFNGNISRRKACYRWELFPIINWGSDALLQLEWDFFPNVMVCQTAELPELGVNIPSSSPGFAMKQCVTLGKSPCLSSFSIIFYKVRKLDWIVFEVPYRSTTVWISQVKLLLQATEVDLITKCLFLTCIKKSVLLSLFWIAQVLHPFFHISLFENGEAWKLSGKKQLMVFPHKNNKKKPINNSKNPLGTDWLLLYNYQVHQREHKSPIHISTWKDEDLIFAFVTKNWK